MSYKLSFLKEVISDYKSLDGSLRVVVDKALKKILLNPRPNYNGGYGKPLSNLNNSKLAGLLKVKLKSHGIRIIYRLIESDNIVLIIIIGFRRGDKVYKDVLDRL